MWTAFSGMIALNQRANLVLLVKGLTGDSASQRCLVALHRSLIKCYQTRSIWFRWQWYLRHQHRCNLWVHRFSRYEISQPIEISVVWIMLSWKDWNNKIDFRNNDWNPPIIDRSSNQHSSCHIKWVSRNHEFVSMSFFVENSPFCQTMRFQNIFDEIAGKTFKII